MRKVTYSMGMSLDGFITDPAGEFAWGAPSEEVFRSSIEEIHDVGVHLMGRRIYETMRYWETVDPATLGDLELEWRDLWNALPKVVFSRTLAQVDGAGARLATGTLPEEIERLRAEPGEGNIAVAGAGLAAQVADLGLIDEYLVRVFPVLVGGGTPFFARNEQHVDLELVEARTFDNGVVRLHHRVRR